LMAWRRSSAAKLGNNLIDPGVVGVISFAIFILAYKRFGVALSFASAVFVTASILYDLAIETKARRTFHQDENPLSLVFNLMRARARKYGGYIVHLGVVFIAVGIVTSNAFKQEKTVKLEPNDKTEFIGFEIQYHGIKFKHESSKVIASGLLTVYPNNKKNPDGNQVWTLTPSKVFYRTSDQLHTEVDIRQIGVDDFYTILAGYQAGDNQEKFATFKFLYMPGVRLIWYGFYVLLFGGLFALFGNVGLRKKTKRARA